MITYETKNVCSKCINFDINDNIVSHVEFIGGCHGNGKAVAALVEGQHIDEVIKRLRGITCRNKDTSCADQLAVALESIEH